MAVDPEGLSLARSLDVPATLCRRTGGSDLLSAPLLARHLDRSPPDVIHAWGVRAAAAARYAKPPAARLVVTIRNPSLAARDVKLLRVLSGSAGFAIACSNGTVHRRLVEQGVPLGRCVVVRPSVDFARINRVKRSDLRRQLGVLPEQRLVALPLLPRGTDDFDAAWSIILKDHALPQRTYRVAISGKTSDARRIRVVASAQTHPYVLLRPPAGTAMEDLISASDLLLFFARGDVDTSAIVWAMASNTCAIASATHAVTELIAHKVNGLLFKYDPHKSNVIAVSRLLDDRDAQRKAVEAAHGQAYEVFSMRRYVEQIQRLYENMIAGTEPGEGLSDPAMSSHA